MGKGFRGFILAVFAFAVVQTQANAFNLVAAAQDALAITFKQLEAGGVKRMDPYHPSLPRPQVQALEALVNPKTGAFSYYDIEYFGPTIHTFKARNGGSNYTVTVTAEHIQFSTYFAGNVAHANRFKTIHGWDYNFWCRGSFQVNKAQWDTCVADGFIAPLRREMTGK